MKQYLSPEQTAKLIELGFAQPRTKIPYEVGNEKLGYIYSIGELIEMLPEKITDRHDRDAILQMTCYNGKWRVKYAGAYDLGLMISEELIDALYDMVVILKEGE